MADPLTIGALVLSAGSSIYGAYQSNQRADEQSERLEAGASRADSMMSEGPTAYEGLLQQIIGDIPERPNLGQDAIMQMLTSSPSTQVTDDIVGILSGVAETGAPFDTSEVFDTLGETDRRQRGEALAEYRAGSEGGLGARFGTAARMGESDLISRLIETQAARNAQVAMGSHEAAQQRRLGASGQLLQRAGNVEDRSLQRARDITNYILGRGQLQVGAASSLIGAEQSRRAENTRLLSLGLGLPIDQGPSYGYGQAGQDVSSLMLMLPFLEQLMSDSGGGETA